MDIVKNTTPYVGRIKFKFKEDYTPVVGDYDKKEFDKYYKKFKKGLSNANDFDKKHVYNEGIASVIPFNKRGKKVIENWKEARESAVSFSKYLS